MLVPPVIVMRGAFKDEADDDVQSVRHSEVQAAEVIILGPGHITDVQKAMTCPCDTSKQFDGQMQQKDEARPTGSMDEDAEEEDAEEEDAEEEDAEEELSVQHDQVIQELQQKVQQLSREASKQRKIIRKIPNHTRPGAHAPQLRRPHLKYARHLQRSTEVHVQSAGLHRRHSVHGVRLSTVRGPTSPHLAPGPVLAPTPPWEASAPSGHQARQKQHHRCPRQPAPSTVINSALANARMPLIDTGCPTPDDTTHR